MFQSNRWVWQRNTCIVVPLRKCRSLSYHRPRRGDRNTFVNGMEIFTPIQRLRSKIKHIMGKKIESSQFRWLSCSCISVCTEQDSCCTIFRMHASLGLADSLFIYLNLILLIRISQFFDLHFFLLFLSVMKSILLCWIQLAVSLCILKSSGTRTVKTNTNISVRLPTFLSQESAEQ